MTPTKVLVPLRAPAGASSLSRVSPQAGQGGAAWLPDPEGRYDYRYWDGSAWTTAVIREGQVDTDAVPVAVPQHQQPPMALPAYQDRNALDRTTSLPPDVAMHRTGQLLAASGWSVTVTAPHTLRGIVSVPGTPNYVVGVLLCLLWLVPGVVYFAVKLRAQPHQADIAVLPDGQGARIVVTCDQQAAERLIPALSQLPW